MTADPMDPRCLTGLDVPIERLKEVALEYTAIRVEIEKLRQLDLNEIHPAIVYRPVYRDVNK